MWFTPYPYVPLRQRDRFSLSAQHRHLCSKRAPQQPLPKVVDVASCSHLRAAHPAPVFRIVAAANRELAALKKRIADGRKGGKKGGKTTAAAGASRKGDGRLNLNRAGLYDDKEPPETAAPAEVCACVYVSDFFDACFCFLENVAQQLYLTSAAVNSCGSCRGCDVLKRRCGGW